MDKKQQLWMSPQTVLILVLPLIQTSTYPDSFSVIALPRQSRHLLNRVCSVERCAIVVEDLAFGMIVSQLLL